MRRRTTRSAFRVPERIPPQTGRAAWGRRQSQPGLLALGALFFLTGVFTPCRAEQPQSVGLNGSLPTHAKAARRFLAQCMDLGLDEVAVYDEANSGFQAFFPVFIGDHADLAIQPGCTRTPKSGHHCMKIEYAPRGNKRWAGIQFVYPPFVDNKPPWEADRFGRSLRGAEWFSFWLRADRPAYVEISIGGYEFKSPGGRTLHKDVFGPIPRAGAHVQEVSTSWQRFTIRVPARARVAPIMGGLNIVFSRSNNREGCTVYLDRAIYEGCRPPQGDSPRRLRFLRSFVPEAADMQIAPAAYTYDQTLALLYFLTQEDSDSRRRARILADSLVYAQTHDRSFTDKARWRNAYSCGQLADYATDTARLPCSDDPKTGRVLEDKHQVSSFTGDVAWAALALASAHQVLCEGEASSDYLGSALRAAQWIEDTFRVETGLGGYAGGFEGWEPNPQKLDWVSVEHNIDVYVLFGKLCEITGDRKWLTRANWARDYVIRLFNKEKGCFHVGTKDSEGNLNTTATAIDPSIWSLLAMGHEPEFRAAIGWDPSSSELPRQVRWLESTCKLREGGKEGFRFSDNGKGIWLEGTCQMASLYRYLGRHERAEEILRNVILMSRARSSRRSSSLEPAAGGIMAAFPEDAFTGYIRDFGGTKPQPWVYHRRPAVAATCWFLFALEGVNPYWIATPDRASAR